MEATYPWVPGNGLLVVGTALADAFGMATDVTVSPARPLIYHITHVDNLAQIVADGCLYSDSTIASRGGTVVVGMQSIKARRLTLPVRCHPGDYVGNFVPFYFCPRSVMLYLIYRANHPELSYKGGQGPIVHLEADLKNVVAWAGGTGRRWAFTLSNAGAYYTEFRKDLAHLDDLNWQSIDATNWRDPDVREAKQAEFLVHADFPFGLVGRIGVSSEAVRKQALAHLAGSGHKPPVAITPGWYY
jgi:hypothetical protein